MSTAQTSESPPSAALCRAAKAATSDGRPSVQTAAPLSTIRYHMAILYNNNRVVSSARPRRCGTAIGRGKAPRRLSYFFLFSARRTASSKPAGPGKGSLGPPDESRADQKRQPGRDRAQLREPWLQTRSGAPADALAPGGPAGGLTNTDGAFSPPSFHTLREEIAHSAAIVI